MSSSWIKLDQSFNRSLQPRNSRNKRIHRDEVGKNISNIEDEEENESFPCHSSTSTVKKRKIKSLENVNVYNQNESSDECEVEYDPDGTQLPNNGVNVKIKSSLPVYASTSRPHSRQLSTSINTNSAKTQTWKSWKTFPKPTNDIADTIDDSDDSDESSPPQPPINIIDECSTDSSQMQSQFALQKMTESIAPLRLSQVAAETLIESEESITPPVQPFIVNVTNKPKKRKVRVVKGGMVERLTKALSKAKSDLLFWQHHRSAELVLPGSLVVVNRVEKTYGRTLVHTKVNNKPTIFSLCSGRLEVEKDDVLEVEFDNCKKYETDTHVLYSYVDKVLQIK